MGNGRNKVELAARNTALVLTESVRAFFRNDGLTASSSLAFFSTIAMIPALFLLTYVNSFSEGISHLMILKSQTVLEEFIPASSAEVLDQLLSVSAPKHALGLINILILLWSITPLMSAIRRAFANIYKTGRKHLYFIVKLLDILLVTSFVLSYATIATSGVLLSLLPAEFIPAYFKTVLPYLALIGLIFVSYKAFSPKVNSRYLFAGAFVSTTLWFVMRPAFNVFLTYNAKFGFIFGSLKSIFVVVLWIYLSQCIYLFGVEVAATLRRREALVIKKLMDGKSPEYMRTAHSLLRSFGPGETILKEGGSHPWMYFIRSGSVIVKKDGIKIAELGEGRFLGEMSFLLDEPRSATASSVGQVELITISHDNFSVLTREFPNIVKEMLEEMARRLKSTTELVI